MRSVRCSRSREVRTICYEIRKSSKDVREVTKFVKVRTSSTVELRRWESSSEDHSVGIILADFFNLFTAYMLATHVTNVLSVHFQRRFQVENV